VVARKTAMLARYRRQVWSGVAVGLNAGLLVVREDRHVGLAGCLGAQHSNLLIDAQDLGLFLIKVWIAPLEIIAHLVGLHLVPREDLTDRALGDASQAGMPPGERTVLASVAGQQTRRPQLMRISDILCLLTGQRNHPGTRLRGDLWLLSRPGAVIQRRHDAELRCSRHAALHGLVRHPNCSTDCVARGSS
jgi:hypothetical protein